jgi:hypothetical protein
MGRIPAGFLDCMQQFQLLLLANRAQRVCSAGNHGLAHHIWSVCNQLERHRSTGAGAHDVHRRAEVVANCLGMPLCEVVPAAIPGQRLVKYTSKPALANGVSVLSASVRSKPGLGFR